MSISTRLSAFKSNVTSAISNTATNISNKVNNAKNGVIRGATNFKNYVVTSLTISEEKKAKIRNFVNKMKNVANKIIAFIYKNRSLIFFALSVWLSYYMAPAAAFEYLSKIGYSLTKTFVSGMLLGTSLLTLKNILFSYPMRKTQENENKTTNDDKVNYLLGISNLCLTYLNPAMSIGCSIASVGLFAVKTAYNFLLPEDERDTKITFLVPNNIG